MVKVNLTAEAMLSIARTLTGDTMRGQRRRLPRVGMGHVLHLIPVAEADDDFDPPAPFQARLRDLSRRGIGVMAPMELAEGQAVLMALPHEVGRGVYHLLARVIRCETIAGHHHVGLEVLIDAPRATVDRYLDRSRRMAA